MSNSSSMANFKGILIEHGVILWRHKWLALASAWLVCLAGWTGVMMMPRQYASNARAFVDVNGLLTPLLRGLVVDTNTKQTNDYLRQTLLSRPNLEQVVSLAQLDVGKNNAEKEMLISGLSTGVVVRAQGQNLFTISYVHANPVVAKNVVESLLTIFAEKAASSSRVEMEKARKFLDEQIAAYEEQLRAAELRRAQFRREYADALADPISGLPKLQTLQAQVAQARLAYNQLVVTRDSLEAQLKQVPATHSVAAGPTVGADGTITTGPAAARLAQVNATVAALRLKYTDQHPDVIAARNVVAQIQNQIAAEAASAASAPATGGSTTNPMTEVSNPAYAQIQMRLVDASIVIPAAKQRLDQAVADFERMKALSAEVPDIDAKAKDLDRDYEVIKTNHSELITRRESANLSQAADDQADRTQFRIVDPPQVPLNPSFPNLPVMFSIVLLMGIGAGASIPIALELVRATFSSVARLRSLGLPVIGSVTYVRRTSARRSFVTGAAGAVVAVATLLVIYGALLVFGDGRGIL